MPKHSELVKNITYTVDFAYTGDDAWRNGEIDGCFEIIRSRRYVLETLTLEILVNPKRPLKSVVRHLEEMCLELFRKGLVKDIKIITDLARLHPIDGCDITKVGRLIEFKRRALPIERGEGGLLYPLTASLSSNADIERVVRFVINDEEAGI